MKNCNYNIKTNLFLKLLRISEEYIPKVFKDMSRLTD